MEGWLLTHPTLDYYSVPAVKHSQPQLQECPAHPDTLPFLPVTSRANLGQTGTLGHQLWSISLGATVTVWIYRPLEQLRRHLLSFKTSCMFLRLL